MLSQPQKNERARGRGAKRERKVAEREDTREREKFRRAYTRDISYSVKISPRVSAKQELFGNSRIRKFPSPGNTGFRRIHACEHVRSTCSSRKLLRSSLPPSSPCAGSFSRNFRVWNVTNDSWSRCSCEDSQIRYETFKRGTEEPRARGFLISSMCVFVRVHVRASLFFKFLLPARFGLSLSLRENFSPARSRTGKFPDARTEAVEGEGWGVARGKKFENCTRLAASKPFKPAWRQAAVVLPPPRNEIAEITQAKRSTLEYLANQSRGYASVITLTWNGIVSIETLSLIIDQRSVSQDFSLFLFSFEIFLFPLLGKSWTLKFNRTDGITSHES